MRQRSRSSEARLAACFSLPWCDPLDILADVADEPHALAFLSDGSALGRWSYVLRRPRAVFSTMHEAIAALPRPPVALNEPDDDLPPFRGGLAGLASYEWSAALEPVCPQERTRAWPDLTVGLYDNLLAFDHHKQCVWSIGPDAPGGEAWCRHDRDGSPGRRPARFVEADQARPYPRIVGSVIDSICSGEIFQANVARTWIGELRDGRPFDIMRQLTITSPAPFGAYFRLSNLALVSNSPERFIRVTASGEVETRPIKGTRPRGQCEAEDRALAAELVGSDKDRAENLMIVDLMRNDLSRTCRIGSVQVEAFCALESFANVHHLVSTITGRLMEQASALDLFARAFPPGSITGAPKLQAMKVIARHESPRGPYCGSLFWFGFDGAFDSNVLIRTVAFEQDGGTWHFETRAGAGITADSDPLAEYAEAEAKMASIRGALTNP